MEGVLVELTAILQASNPSYVLLAIAVYYLSVYIWASRWKTTLSLLGYRVKAAALLPIVMGGIFFNNVTPSSRVGGEPVRVYWLRDAAGVPLTAGALSIFYERASEAVPVSVLAFYASLVLKNFLPPMGILRDALFALAVVAVTAYILRKKSPAMRFLAKRRLAKERQGMLAIIVMSSLIWVLDVLRFKFISQALGVSLPISIIAVMSFLYLVLGAVPLTPGGIGVVEGGFVSAVAAMGVGVPAAIGVIMVERSISLITSTALGGICVMSYGGQKLWRHARSL
ncbi:MAG: flippase-like domain-containing protein [Euryarchaeota archaeon]|nr:flippase-like domain-containing protein [Euryarchaeota archaeon]